MINSLKLLWGFCDTRRKVHFIALIVLTLFSSLIEVFTIASIMPFIAIVSDPNNIMKYDFVVFLTSKIGITDASQLIFPSAIIFIIFAGLGASFRILVLLFNTNFSVSFGVFLSQEAYRNTLYRPYIEHTQINSSFIISAIVEKVNGVIFHIINGALSMISSAILLIFILTGLMIIDLKIALFSGVLILSLYGVVSYFVYKKVEASSRIVAYQQTNLITLLKESLGSIRDIILSSLQESFVKNFYKQNFKLRHTLGMQGIIGSLPRYFIEALILILIVGFIAIIFTKYQINFTMYLPIIGAMALGAQKLIPSAQMIYQCWIRISSNKDAFTEVLSILTKSTENNVMKNISTDDKLEFNKLVSFHGVSFKYFKDSPLILNNINLSLMRGDKIGIVGLTGSGKSTFLDLLLGLLTPSEGKIFIDNQKLGLSNMNRWQKMISHVPQHIFLNDISICENIAFGIDKADINFEKIKNILKIVRADKFVNNLKDGLYTMVGEEGIQLSGGQRQRIGIARALYSSFDLLVLDEATNALDSETEKLILEEIYDKYNNKTIIILTHRDSSLEKCDIVYNVKDGRVISI